MSRVILGINVTKYEDSVVVYLHHASFEPAQGFFDDSDLALTCEEIETLFGSTLSEILDEFNEKYLFHELTISIGENRII